MSLSIFGTKDKQGGQHPVFDIEHWKRAFSLKEDDRSNRGMISCPQSLAEREQALQRVQIKGNLGAWVPSDVFVYANDSSPKRPWLTRLGGKPWRPKRKAWPRDENGMPLIFLGQICFADSTNILPVKLPGDVALIFGTIRLGYVSIIEGSALEWSPLQIDEPEAEVNIPSHGLLPFDYQGVRHRTIQYTDWKVADPVFSALGYLHGGLGVRSMQATSIGTYADLPQGWPFEEGDGNTLVATLNSFSFGGEWPLCNVHGGYQKVYQNGRSSSFRLPERDFKVGDLGCIWIYRNKAGEFKLEEAF